MNEFKAELARYLEGVSELSSVESVLARTLQANPAAGPEILQLLDQLFRASRLPARTYIELKQRIPETPPPQSPQSTTQPPQSTTQPPQSTTQPPQSTTQPPQSTTQPPQSTTQPPQSTAAVNDPAAAVNDPAAAVNDPAAASARCRRRGQFRYPRYSPGTLV
jgi:hypothetical protein